MFKKILSVLLVMTFVLSMPVCAMQSRSAISKPNLTISNGTATCTFTHYESDSTDKISVTLRLYRGQTLVNTWTGSGYGSVYMKKTANAVSGATYQLTANVYVNDSLVGSNSTTKYY